MIETQQGKEPFGPLDKINEALSKFKKSISESLSKPKEGSEENKRLNDFLGEKINEGESVEDYLKYWTVKKTKTAIKLINEGIMKRENISKNGAYMDKWDDKKIGIAKKLSGLGMEISPYNHEFMKYWTENEIENLKLFKEKNGNSLDYLDVHPIFGEETSSKIGAMDYGMFKNGIPTEIINNNFIKK